MWYFAATGLLQIISDMCWRGSKELETDVQFCLDLFTLNRWWKELNESTSGHCTMHIETSYLLTSPNSNGLYKHDFHLHFKIHCRTCKGQLVWLVKMYLGHKGITRTKKSACLLHVIVANPIRLDCISREKQWMLLGPCHRKLRLQCWRHLHATVCPHCHLPLKKLHNLVMWFCIYSPLLADFYMLAWRHQCSCVFRTVLSNSLFACISRTG